LIDRTRAFAGQVEREFAWKFWTDVDHGGVIDPAAESVAIKLLVMPVENSSLVKC
jgi:hypothetical protein